MRNNKNSFLTENKKINWLQAINSKCIFVSETSLSNLLHNILINNWILNQTSYRFLLILLAKHNITNLDIINKRNVNDNLWYKLNFKYF